MFLLLLINAMMLQSITAVNVCTKFWVRKEWRELTSSEMSSFFSAIKCLKSKPSKYHPSLGSTSIYDDMVYIHIFSNDVAHKVAAFLPWHRQFLSIFENLLRDECGYEGSIPYWDFAMDSQAPERSPVFYRNAFGGDGGANGCLTDGAFTNWSSTFPHKMPCITRRYNMHAQYGHLMGAQYSPEQIELMLQYRRFYEFSKVIEEHPHNMAHYGIGGTMFDPKTATNDPIFWIIHTNVDRIWYTWQKRHPDLANTYNGNRRPNSTAQDASAEDMLRFYGLGDDVTVKDTFSTESLRYCYVYSNSIMPIRIRSVAKRSFISKLGDAVSDASASLRTGGLGKQLKSLRESFSFGPFDRTSDPSKLRKAIEFPDSFLHKKYTPETVAQIREREKMFASLVEEANRNNFHSPAALENFGSWASASTANVVNFQIKMSKLSKVFSSVRNKFFNMRDNLLNRLDQIG
jgi:hypothetical protein